MGPSELEVVLSLLYATYHPGEPLTRHLGLGDRGTLGDLDRLVAQRLAKNLTL